MLNTILYWLNWKFVNWKIYLISTLSFAVDPPSDLNFKIIDENTVHMSWARPADPIVGYRITVDPTTGKFWDVGVLKQRHQRWYKPVFSPPSISLWESWYLENLRNSTNVTRYLVNSGSSDFQPSTHYYIFVVLSFIKMVHCAKLLLLKVDFFFLAWSEYCL